MLPANQASGLRPDHRDTRACRGFTLIELIAVIVILGILAISALPKLIILTKESRIAALNGMTGALQSAAQLTRLRCAASAACTPVTQGNLTINGTLHYVWYGWPIESTRQGFWSIADLIDYSGFTYSSALVSGQFLAYFDRSDAPTPSACRVIYQYQEADAAPFVTTVTSGC